MIADTFERTPARIRLLSRIRGYEEVPEALVTGAILDVSTIEADRRGVMVQTRAGRFVSLHPSEFEVIEWASPEDIKLMGTSTTALTAEQTNATFAESGHRRRGAARGEGQTATATRRIPAKQDAGEVNAAEVAKLARALDEKTAVRHSPATSAEQEKERIARLVELAQLIRHRLPQVIAKKIDELPRDSAIALLVKECSENVSGRNLLLAYGYEANGGKVIDGNGHSFEWYEVLDDLLNDLFDAPPTSTELAAADRAEKGLDQLQPRTAEVKPLSTPKATALRSKAAKKCDGQPAKRVLERGVMIPICELERHPANRVPSAADIAARAESLKADGQFDDVEVRRRPNAPYQIVSGETRTLAAKLNGETAIRCTVIECSDAEALRLVAEHNGQRTDLNPIQRAQLIERLCMSIDQGGAGLTREQAAKSVGLASHSAASNLVRLLQLPKVWQDRVANGQMPESFARQLLPIANAPLLLDEVEKSYTSAHTAKPSAYEKRRWESRSDIGYYVANLIGSHTRPIDSKTRHYYTYDAIGDFGDFPRLFKLNDELEKELQIVEFDIDGKKQLRATNAKLFDKLNIPLIKQKLAEKAKRSSSKGGKDANGQPRKLTPAEEQQKKKERAEQLAGRVAAWRHQWLKALVAAKLETCPAIGERVLIWLATNPLTCFGLCDLIETPIVLAARELGGVGCNPWEAMQGLGTDEGALRTVARQMVRNVLLAEDRDARRPTIPFAYLDDLAAMASIDLAAEWRDLQGPKADEQMRARFESFFALHQAEQLDAVAKELGIPLSAAPAKAGKLQLLSIKAESIRLGELPPLRLPKAIKPVAARAVRKSGKNGR